MKGGIDQDLKRRRDEEPTANPKEQDGYQINPKSDLTLEPTMQC